MKKLLKSNNSMQIIIKLKNIENKTDFSKKVIPLFALKLFIIKFNEIRDEMTK